MKGPVFQNERTLASAGSGKTYALTNRFIALVLGGAKPEEICALTFTRKAAGEFFSKTMSKLARAAADPEFAASLARDISAAAPLLPPPSRGDFEEALAKFAEAAPRLHMETIDSFVSRFVRFFAAELGIFEDIQILDDLGAARENARAAEEVLRRFSSEEGDFQNFARAFKAANFGAENKRVADALISFIENSRDIWFAIPDASRWGDFPGFSPPDAPARNSDEYRAILARAAEELEKCGDPKEAAAKGAILKFFAEADFETAPKSKTKAALAFCEYFAERGTCRGFEAPPSRGGALYPLTLEESRLFDGAARSLLRAHASSARDAAKAVFSIMGAFSGAYSECALSRGRMAFSDMPALVASSGARTARELVEYRFDSRFSHWLFDEFQDTSRMQWAVFEPIVREAATNSGGEKTFFYVGDVKQSIYSWRGGDSALFDEIYDKMDGAVRDNPQIKTSWRSCPAVISAVNAVFSDGRAMALHFGEKAAGRWGRIWENHDTAAPNSSMRGAVTAERAESDEDAADRAYEFAKSLNPVARGLTCAVLVQRNKTAARIIETFRRRAAEDGIPMRAAGELDVDISSDNMACPAMLSFALAAAHPADTLSLGYAKMTPLKPLLGGDKWRENFLGTASDLGLAAALSRPAKALMEACEPGDSFTRNRIAQFMEMARKFDAQNIRDIDEFVEAARKFRIREGASSDTVQVMSIHKSKGLDFDVVILPELGNPAGGHGGRISATPSGFALALPADSVCRLDKTLSAAAAELADERAYDSLCRFYVALTRAKRAMHLILPREPASKPASRGGFAAMLSDIFDIPERKPGDAPATLFGDASWAGDFPERPPEPRRDGGESFGSPQIPEYECGPAEPPAGARDESSAQTGLALHSIFERLGPESPSLECAAEAARPMYADFPDEFDEAFDMAKRCMENPAISEVFKCRNFWAEKPYAVFKNGALECGRFDRVNFPTQGGCAEIVDFKSDDAPAGELAARYAPQLARYASALEILSGIAPEKISLKIVAARRAEIVPVRLPQGITA